MASRTPPPPTLSIGLPVYNGEKYLEGAIASILSQDYEDFELIVCDNASTDSTAAICESFARRDPRLRYSRNPENIGAAPNHNRVFELARGRFFKWAAHDDECMPGMLRRCVETLAGAPASVALVYPQLLLVDDNDAVIREETLAYDVVSLDTRAARPHERLAWVLSRIVLGTPMYGVMRSDLLRKTRLIGSFHTSDYVLLAELAMLGEFWEIPEKLIRRRLHTGRSTAANPTRKALEAWLDPSRGGKRDLLPIEDRLAWEYVKSARRMPLGPVDRALCIMAALSVTYRIRALRTAGRWKRSLLGAPKDKRRNR